MMAKAKKPKHGGPREGAGRPRKEDKKKTRQVYISDSELDGIKEKWGTLKDAVDKQIIQKLPKPRTPRQPL